MEESAINHKNIMYPPGGILMWIIIYLELFTFGVALLALVITKQSNPTEFSQSANLLNTTFGTINTIFLLTSGYFMARTIDLVKKKNQILAKRFLLFTMIGGLLFLLLKSFEYKLKIDEGLTMGYDSFFSYYWLLTGFHVIHVLVGLVILLLFYFKLNKNKSIAIDDLEAGGAFWHMCDLVWLLLFPILYLII
jgi:nitric oxide reductase NorE protein